MKNKSVLGTILLFITAFIWGIAFVFQRTGMDSVGPLTFMASRCILAVGALSLVLLVKYGSKEAFKFDKSTLKGGLSCGILITIANNLQQIGMQYTNAGKAGFITAMYILLVPVFGVLFLKKKETVRVWLAVLLGAVGMYLLCITDSFTVTAGDLWIMGCAMFFSCHILCADNFAGKSDPLKMSFLQFLICTVLGLILAFVFETPEWTGILNAKAAILYCGVLSACVGYTLQIVAQRWVEPTTASLVMSLESVFAVLSGWLILHETMSSREIIGCVVMFAAIILVETKPSQK